MTIPETILALYLALINILAFALYGIDKKKAKDHAWRISERTLLLVAALFGAAGALAGMYTFHHKTRKMKFSVGVPLLLIAQVLIAAGLRSRI